MLVHQPAQRPAQGSLGQTAPRRLRARGRTLHDLRRGGRLEAHEVWSYDDEKHIQKLEDIVAVCRACHEVIHIGRTALMGREAEAQAHFCKVNGATQSEYHAALGEANRVHAERSRHEWVTDISKLKDLLR